RWSKFTLGKCVFIVTRTKGSGNLSDARMKSTSFSMEKWLAGAGQSPETWRMNLFARRRVADLQSEALKDQRLKRALGPINLTSLGIGAIIGAGIFVLTGQAAAQYAGPGIVYSFLLSGLACAFAGLCYAEFASMIPLSGSAYTYGYATLGEFVA